MIIPTKNPDYTIHQYDFGTPEYIRVVNGVTEAGGFSFSLAHFAQKVYGDAFQYKVLALADKSQTALCACIVVSNSSDTIQEIYSYTKHSSAQKGECSLLLSTLIDYHRSDTSKETIVWVGVKQEVDGSHMALINKVYRPLGFYFPQVFPDRSVGSNTSPLGIVHPFRFFDGYWSTDVGGLSIPIHVVTLGEKDPITQTLRTMFFSAKHELSGICRIGDRGYLRMDSKLDSGADQCTVQLKTDDPSKGYLFNFHTHPYVCHESSGLYLGFPSILDYKTCISMFLKKEIDGHFIFSVEGVFFLQLHPRIKQLLLEVDASPVSAAEQLMNEITDYLLSINYEEKRKLPKFTSPNGDVIMADTPEQREAINTFVESRIEELFYDIGVFRITIRGVKIPLFYLQFSPNHIGDQQFFVPNFSIRD